VKKTSYHHHLTADRERLAGFCEAIEKVRGTVYDIGAGSGILSSWAAEHADFVYAVELDGKLAQQARSSLKSFGNILVLEGNAGEIQFPKKADFIICEMLDTALIDEEQVPVLNSVLKFLKKGGDVIPRGVINSIEPVYLESEHICYQENERPRHEVMGPPLTYSRYDFREPLEPFADFQLKLKINRDGIFKGVKITTYTLITPHIICGPTPMLNPPLLIPTEKIMVKKEDIITLELSYLMGGGLNSIRTEINQIP
jgi:predicted RNA methylase